MNGLGPHKSLLGWKCASVKGYALRKRISTSVFITNEVGTNETKKANMMAFVNSKL